jgi:hypothetical protein
VQRSLCPASTEQQSDQGNWGSSIRVGATREQQDPQHLPCILPQEGMGQQVFDSADLPPLYEERQLLLAPERIVDVREWRLWSKVIREYLVVWRGLSTKDATWEEEQILQHPNLELLGDKQSWEGRTVMSPSN